MDFQNMAYMWSNYTLLLYFGIIASCYIICVFCKNQYIQFGVYKKKIQVSLLFTGLILIFFKGFGTAGRDLRSGYYMNFLSATSMDDFRDKSTEIGYRVLNVIIRNITDQYWVFIFIISLLTIIPVLKIVKKYWNKIDGPLTILLFVSVFYISGFSPLRAYLASSIALFAFDAMVEKNAKKAFIWIVISMCFHISMAFLFLPYIFCFFKIFNKKFIVASLVILFLLFYIERNSIVSILAGSERYFNYGLADSIEFGFEQIAYYLPFFIIIYLGRKNNDKNFFKTSFVYLCTGFCFGMLGYIVPIFGRTHVLFLPVIIISGYYLKFLKNKYITCKWLINFTTILYCMARFWIYIYQYYNLEDIMPYTNIFGWIII